MRSDRPFASFARRVTIGYAVLAVVLMLLVVGVSSVFAAVLYIGSVDDAIASSVQKANSLAEQYQAEGLSLPQYAPQIVDALNRSHVHVFVMGADEQILAGAMPHGMRPGPPRGLHAMFAIFGLHPAFAHVPGGVIGVTPDIDDISRAFEHYIAVVVPVGLAAIVLAWFFGSRVTSRAIAPLADVTRSLRRIAAGDFSPEPLLEGNAELRDLTDAYNDVAYRLTAASAERERHELQMRQFIADAGHELRTPLTVVMGYLEMLSQGAIGDPDGIARVHATMLSESRRMRAVIEKLIFLARLERPATPKVEAVDVCELASRVATALEPIAGAGRIRLDAEGAAIVQGDDGELYEALKNVVENAVRYAPESPVAVSVRREGATVRVEVADSGPGMTAQEIEHAFDRFYRGSARAANGDPIEGSGLGLAIAKRAVERAGGSIAIDSLQGEGTRVSFTLPAA